MKTLVAMLLIAVSAAAEADSGGYVIQQPGQFHTYVTPNGAGSYTVTQPGQLSTYITPDGRGGYVVQQPGQFPAYVTPTSPNTYQHYYYGR